MLIFMLVLAGCGVAAYRWRWGVAAAILIGLLQDPLRKMIPGTPGYLAMATLPVWMATLASALFSGEVRTGIFLSTFPRLARWFSAFGLYLLIPAVISGTYGENSWQITLLGAVIYSAAFLMLAAGWWFPCTESSAIRILSFYALCTAVFLIGGPLDYFGVFDGWLALGTEAMDTVWMTARTGEIIYMYAGFFRSPDVMGWHAALLTMIASLMASRSRGWVRYVWIALSIWGLLNIWMCGRRKMISMLPIFWGVYLMLTFKFRQARRAVPLAATLLLVLGLGWYGITRTYKTTAMDTFYMTTFEQLGDSAMQHGVLSVVTTVKQAGFFGYGLGMGQQGIHHIKAETPRLWQESGPSKLVAELGVPGFALLLCLGAILLLTSYHVIGYNKDSSLFYMCAGIFSILIANMASGVISGQIFGDPFILLLLAFMTGMLLSGARSRAVSEEVSCPS
jgi:hypothetical protein